MEYKKQFQRWLDSAVVDEATKEELRGLTEAEIEDRFYRELAFGTGGLRGVMAAGTNRMNVYTVRLATQGLANELMSHGKALTEQGVVIAHDSRNNSRAFAMECIKVLTANGIKTYFFDSLRPTPELSFAVRHLGCARGIVITASHNPKEYNGYKVYGEDGGQIPPEIADRVLEYINATDIFDGVKVSEAMEYTDVSQRVDAAYLEAVKAQSLGIAIPEDFKVVYTPLHGSGNIPVQNILKEIGVSSLFVVPEQEQPDGNFPTVNSPNPENSEAFTLAIKYAKEQNADLIFGTDPDSDRIGVVVRDKDGNYAVLNGNQTGSLLCEFILRKDKEFGRIPAQAAVIKTIVTTEMVRAIAKDYDVETMDVLTGFKFIGDKIKEFESSGSAERFRFGLEESYGYLKGSYARDKDAVVAAMLVAEAAADYKARGMTLYDGLMNLYETYGYFKEHLENRTLEGIEGVERIREIMKNFRENGLPIPVEKMLDYQTGIDGLPKSDVLKFFLADGSWIAVRPSGTEPKIKFYFGVCGKTEAEADGKIAALVSQVMQMV